MVALATKNNNECLDQFLTHGYKSLKDLQPGEHLVAIYSKRPKILDNDLGLYEKIKIIGKGGFAEKVYLARYKENGSLVAIKTISKQFILKEQGRYNQVFSELKVMQQLLEHPFVIKLQRAFASKDDLHLVVDFCAGGELFYLLQEKGRFTEAEARFYFAEMLLGLEYIHKQNVLYRDLKPENVFLDIDGHIRLADFGLSKIQSFKGLNDTYCGSAEYMSPEMLSGDHYGYAVDYYSLGAVLYEMVTGLPPFYSTDQNEMFQNALSADLVFPANLVSEELANLLTMLLCKDQFKRISKG
jgi:serine/threonine protein kinase